MSLQQYTLEELKRHQANPYKVDQGNYDFLIGRQQSSDRHLKCPALAVINQEMSTVFYANSLIILFLKIKGTNSKVACLKSM